MNKRSILNALLSSLFGVLLLFLLNVVAYIVVGPLNVDVKSINTIMHMGDNAPILKFVEDPVLGYRLQNNRMDHTFFVDQWNQSHPRKKPAGVYRIICLGGSTTFGTCADPETTYPALLETLFAQLYANCGKRVEVINAGTMGYNSWHSLLRAKAELDAMQPDLYLVMDGVNDIITSMTTSDDTRDQMEKLTAQVNLDSSGKSGMLPLLDAFLQNSALYRLMRRGVEQLQARGVRAQKDIATRIARFGYYKNMADLIVDARSKGITTVLINYPWIVRQSEIFSESKQRIPYDLDENYFLFFQAGRQYVENANHTLSTAYNVLLVDPQPFIDAETGDGRNIHRIYCDSIHFTRLGNFYIAATAFNILKNSKSLKKFIGACVPGDADSIVKTTMRTIDLPPHYLDGTGFPKNPHLAFKTTILHKTGLKYIQGDIIPWKVLTPDDSTSSGEIRLLVRFGNNALERQMADFNAIVYVRFPDPNSAVILKLWDNSSVQLQHPDGPGGQGWSPIGERFGLHLPVPSTDMSEMTIQLIGKAQLWIYDGNIFFYNIAKDRK